MLKFCFFLRKPKVAFCFGVLKSAATDRENVVEPKFRFVPNNQHFLARDRDNFFYKFSHATFSQNLWAWPATATKAIKGNIANE